MTDLTKYNGEKCILDHIELHIEDKDKVGILGVNGTGKSTLLKIIAGIEDYQGKISYQKDIRINYLPQTPLYNEDDSIMETVYKQLDSKEIHDYEIKAQLGKFGIIDETQKIKELSGGQLKRVALAIALIKPCDLLILDEPTNHLDNGMIEYLEKFLIKWSKGLLMVTHDRYFLERVVNRIIEIDHGQIYKYEANYSKYLELKQVRLETQLSSQRKRKLFLKKELEWVRAGVQARTTKSKDRLQRFEELSKVKDVEVNGKVEMIHTYSLIHDDLPALDNDALRRGMPTAHIKFGEAMAILAGDALLNYAFETAAKAFDGTNKDIQTAKALQILTRKPGIYGMIGGQTVDVEQENKAISFDTLMYIHNNKTAALIECAMMIGAVLAGASEKEVSMIEQIANKVGIAFQIEDDILDVVSTSEEIGKPAGSDEKNGKNTYVLFKGIEQSKKDAEQYTREALQIFDELEYKNPFLRELLLYLVGRKN